MMTLQSLPFADVSCLDSSTDSNDSVTSDANIDDHHGCDMLVREHPSKVKFGHINVNSMAGFKFYEIKQWLLVISETKLDATFPDAMFRVDGFRFIRRDRDIYGGGIIIYWRSDLTFEHVRNVPLLSGVEALLVKLRINKSWL